jgi:hypothetical protein
VAEYPFAPLVQDRAEEAIVSVVDFDFAEESPVLRVPQLDLNSLAFAQKTSSWHLLATGESESWSPEARHPAPVAEALCRTRTGDPLLTMEVLYQLS